MSLPPISSLTPPSSSIDEDKNNNAHDCSSNTSSDADLRIVRESIRLLRSRAGLFKSYRHGRWLDVRVKAGLIVLKEEFVTIQVPTTLIPNTCDGYLRESRCLSNLRA
jgi:hypothetical protein